ncbi:hypothetical protein PDJAM_G00101400, partial [Pangasius djambal]|nr:hypothetical protein [Pangasius djambal]
LREYFLLDWIISCVLQDLNLPVTQSFTGQIYQLTETLMCVCVCVCVCILYIQCYSVQSFILTNHYELIISLLIYSVTLIFLTLSLCNLYERFGLL